MAKRTTQRIAEAKRMRAAGHSDRTIASELSKSGEPVSPSAIVNWLGTRSGSRPPTLKGAPAVPEPPKEASPRADRAPTPPVVPEDAAEMAPAEFSAWLATQLRQAQADATECRAQKDNPGAGRAMRLAAQLAALLAKVHARTADDGDVVRVTADEMRAAGERAIRGLATLAERVVQERAGWPKCPGCGMPHGEYPAANKSPIRGLVEHVFGRAL